MGIIFFNSKEKFDRVAELVFAALGIRSYSEGDSVHVAEGYYYSYTIFGVSIRLEINSYGYEDDYQFMIDVRKSFTSSLTVSTQVESMVSNIVIRSIADNLKISLACEKDDKLIVVSSGDNSVIY